MISLVRIVVALVSDAFRLVLLLSRPSAEIHAENLVLRKQLAQYIERESSRGVLILRRGSAWRY